MNTIFQHEVTQAIHNKLIKNDADGRPIPDISTRHRYKESMTTSKETSDDAEMIALMEKARDKYFADQQRRTNTDNDQATLNIKILLKQLRILIYGIITDIIMTIVINTINLRTGEAKD